MSVDIPESGPLGPSRIDRGDAVGDARRATTDQLRPSGDQFQRPLVHFHRTGDAARRDQRGHIFFPWGRGGEDAFVAGGPGHQDLLRNRNILTKCCSASYSGQLELRTQPPPFGNRRSLMKIGSFRHSKAGLRSMRDRSGGWRMRSFVFAGRVYPASSSRLSSPADTTGETCRCRAQTGFARTRQQRTLRKRSDPGFHRRRSGKERCQDDIQTHTGHCGRHTRTGCGNRFLSRTGEAYKRQVDQGCRSTE